MSRQPSLPQAKAWEALLPASTKPLGICRFLSFSLLCLRYTGEKQPSANRTLTYGTNTVDVTNALVKKSYSTNPNFSYIFFAKNLSAQAMSKAAFHICHTPALSAAEALQSVDEVTTQGGQELSLVWPDLWKRLGGLAAMSSGRGGYGLRALRMSMFRPGNCESQLNLSFLKLFDSSATCSSS